MDTAQLYQKLLTDAIRKQMSILGEQITLLKAREIPGMTVTDDGTVAFLKENNVEIVTQFLEEFRELSAPLVKKTMQPLLSALGTPTLQPATQTNNQIPQNSDAAKI
jgi:hypothetical protein